MKIIVTGNICAGKTKLIGEINKTFHFDVVQIDQYRELYGDGTQAGELEARNRFYQAVMDSANQVIECTGVGEVAKKLFEILDASQQQHIIIRVQTEKEICASRSETRLTTVPFPKTSETIKNKINRIDAELSTNMDNIYFGARRTLISVNNNDNTGPGSNAQTMVKSIQHTIGAMRDEEMMTHAINEAKTALSHGGFPVGAALVIDHQLIACAHNQNKKRDSFYHHAENALLIDYSSRIRQARRKKQSVEVFTTLEPCLYCFGGILQHYVTRLVISAVDPVAGACSITRHLPDWYKQKPLTIETGLLIENYLPVLKKYNDDHIAKYDWEEMLAANQMHLI